MQEIDIGVLSKLSGLSTATIRFYESKGLIKSMGRKGLRRQYSEHILPTVKLIKFLREGGLSIAEIEKIFISNHRIQVNRREISEKIHDIELKINHLLEMKSILQHMEHCPFEDHLRCPDFIKIIS
ncbi:hypothetical protein B9T31_07255 [Acinetobacter sp. ANC 4558]|uniref:MerR family transcriptional regulator n=1 Tax=Acinetobacter sp. ANC 4558 TaxID=1977876 RepID=UPI000A358F4F|nr:MerR family transcriptional regulator [Acinetobacter sp. ANC 4558]OTG86779.1 hypothetical protein B9T31_07255 [Acinetobacter sp. ANC 4558]